jgi:hypothetical protein
MLFAGTVPHLSTTFAVVFHDLLDEVLGAADWESQELAVLRIRQYLTRAICDLSHNILQGARPGSTCDRRIAITMREGCELFSTMCRDSVLNTLNYADQQNVIEWHGMEMISCGKACGNLVL